VCVLHTQEMTIAGFSGCIAPTDATHVTMMRCPISRGNEHSGPKEKLPARTYNISVNHRRQILYTTTGHPACWSDKTIALFDSLISQIRKGILLANNTFTLYEYDDNGNVSTRNYNGCWILCDNGYQNWTCLMAPMKDPETSNQ
jgi:hypothetical protein